MAKVALILSGCGVYDGSEIHETVLTMYYLNRVGIDVECLAPEMNQFHVIDHNTQQELSISRSVRVEAARIARGPVGNLAESDPANFDAVVLPGGFGAAKNLCNFAFKGVEAEVQADLKLFLSNAFELRKPIGAMCIAPVILALISDLLKSESKLRLTIGSDTGVGDAIDSLGCENVICSVDEICVDEKNLVITTPAYMLGQTISEVGTGIEKFVQQLRSWIY